MTLNRFSKTIALTALLASSLGVFAASAEAKTKIGIYFGVPFYDTQVDDGYLYEPDYGWYAPEYRPAWRRNFQRTRVSCGQAIRDLRYSGYKNVRTVECQGRAYTFRAHKAGRNLTLSYDSRTGDFSRI